MRFPVPHFMEKGNVIINLQVHLIQNMLISFVFSIHLHNIKLIYLVINSMQLHLHL